MTRTGQCVCALLALLAACSKTIGDPAAIGNSSGLRDGGGDGDGDGDGDSPSGDGDGEGGDGDGDSQSNGDVAGPDGGVAGADAWIVAAVQPDWDCTIAFDNPIVPIGTYDLGGSAPGPSCDKSYRVSFKLASARRDVLELHDAQITLLSADQRTIVFNREADNTLPNPLSFVGTRILLPPADREQTTQGVITLDLIPLSYAAQLAAFEGKQILAEIRLFLTNGSETRVNVPAFVFPIDICVGCLSICSSALGDRSPDELFGDGCADNAGADGRTCIDPDC